MGGSRYSIRMSAILSAILKPEKQGGDCTSITGVSPFHSVLEKLLGNLNLLQDAYVVQPSLICSSVRQLEYSIKKVADSNQFFQKKKKLPYSNDKSFSFSLESNLNIARNRSALFCWRFLFIR
jgi:hypothetical protein